MSIKKRYNDELRFVEYAVEKYSKMLFRICFSFLLNEADAEDALQETFVRYMTKAPLFRDSDHEKAWLIKVATNVCKNMLRFKKLHNHVNLSEIGNICVSPEDADTFEAIMRLPSKYKVILDLYYMEGYKANEIASLLSISQVAVRKRLQYARKMLKDELERNC